MTYQENSKRPYATKQPDWKLDKKAVMRERKERVALGLRVKNWHPKKD